MRFLALPLLLALSSPSSAQEGPAPAAALEQDEARLERLRRARDAMQAAADLDPENSQLWLHLGFIQHKLGNLDGAQRSFEKVVELDETESAAHYMLALIYEKKGLTDKAIASWNACLLHSSDPNLLAIAKKHLKELDR